CAGECHRSSQLRRADCPSLCLDDPALEGACVTAYDTAGGVRRRSLRSRELFGHPLGLTILFGTEMWERFSYYGMRTLLILYLTKYLPLPGHVESVWGYGAVKASLEPFAGPLDVQPLSSLIYGLYTGLVFFTPLFGGWLADAWFGQKRVVMLGIG